MTKQRSSKRALLMSALSLLLCVSMLVGTTYAWFTDEVVSGMNSITAGNLDVELLADGVEVEADTKLFADATLWEPGVVVYENLQIVNKGTLALKYQASLNFGSENDLDGHKLSEVLKVAVIDAVEEGADRAEILADAKAANATSLYDFIVAGELEAGKSTTEQAVVIFWEPNANEIDNLYNANNTKSTSDGQPLHIEFGVNLQATQKDVESDSFGNDYDKGLTPPDQDGDVLKEVDGVIYAYNNDGARLYMVAPEFTGDTVKLIEGIETIGNYAFAYNTNVKKVILSSDVRSLGRGFDSSTVETVVLNEGLEQIDSRAFKSTPNLKEVVIPSTVKTIADNAFQKSGIKNVTIPATVETIGEAAFGSSLIESVTFEGNTSIQGYAFRGCANLRTVVMKGDDVTFIPSTLNGRNSMWFCNGESNNPGTSNIAFYVVNETVAARVRTALAAEKPETTPIYINGQLLVNKEIQVPVASLEEDFLFPAGTNAVIYKDMLLKGDAQIVHTENVVLGLSNVTAELDHDVIVRKSAGAICIENSEFTLTDGAKLITVAEGGDAYQVFLINVKVNGELLTDANAGQYLEGISWFGAYAEWPNT